ncbi:hypothetical protein [Desulfomonile tiedjei]|uniref:Polyketide cyclase / dehydrase and lipid transport n=1 Tax=Desulfomonile tiedjei (strain ATCC 49306 / DSM 6799 / DCB-1) TaxID=706587 RepID=I4C0U8_DESTA|nr:hypothetical protein [Desulfomonile tiedjei]AFM23189.1 hypothetical protein Desti_0454 [Desulfomonile tiedjei DSM 6799]
MTDFRARRVTQEFTHTISAAPSKVFPLLCPVREYEWIEGWTCKMIYSESGYAENNCVFTTNFPRGFEEIWSVSAYDPERYIIQFVVTSPEAYIMKLDISLSESGTNSTNISWIMTFTGLTPKGNTVIENHTGEPQVTRMGLVFKALEHYCLTGEMLKKSSLPPALHG